MSLVIPYIASIIEHTANFRFESKHVRIGGGYIQRFRDDLTSNLFCRFGFLFTIPTEVNDQVKLFLHSSLMFT